MDIIDITSWINVAALVLALCVGYVIKHAVKSERLDDFIPLICAAVGIAVVASTDAASGALTIYSIVIGAMSGLAATGLYEAFANMLGGMSKGE